MPVRQHHSLAEGSQANYHFHTDIYTASRTLFGLAHDGQAPQIFTRVNKDGVPWPAVIVAIIFVALGYLNAKQSAGHVFQYLVSVTTVLSALNWINILLVYVEFLLARKARGETCAELKYHSWGQLYTAFIAFGMTSLIIIFNGTYKFIFLFVSRLSSSGH